METNEKTTEELKTLIMADFNTILKEEKRGRKPYLKPKNDIRTATTTIKLSGCCHYVSIHIPRDLTSAMKLERGKMVQLTIERLDIEEPEDTENVFKEE